MLVKERVRRNDAPTSWQNALIFQDDWPNPYYCWAFKRVLSMTDVAKSTEVAHGRREPYRQSFAGRVRAPSVARIVIITVLSQPSTDFPRRPEEPRSE
jgi:hypothetical protein